MTDVIQESSPVSEGVTSETLPPDVETSVESSPEPTSEPDGPQSLSEAIQQALKPAETAEIQDTETATPETPLESPAETQPEPQEPEEAQTELPPEVTEAELNSYRPRTRQRIKKLLAERDEYRAIAENTREHYEFVAQNQIPNELVEFGLNVAAALKYGDHETLLRAMAPHIQKAQMAVGLTLPPDLQQQVDQGYTTRELASELARQRAVAEQSQARLTETREMQQRQAAYQHQMSIKAAVDNWQAETQKSDPDFARKSELITQYAHGLLAQYGVPDTAEKALAMANEAKRRADEFLKSVSPAPVPQATRPRPSSVEAPRGSVSPAPASLRDAVMAGLKKSA